MSSSRAPSVGSRTNAELARYAPCDTHLAFDPRDQDLLRDASCDDTAQTIGTPSVVSRTTGETPAVLARAPSGLKAPQATRTVLTSEPPPRVSARGGESPSASVTASDLPCGSSRRVTRDASDRLLPSHVFVRAPVPRRFSVASSACASARSRRSPGSRSGRFASAGRTLSRSGVVAVGVVFPP